MFLMILDFRKIVDGGEYKMKKQDVLGEEAGSIYPPSPCANRKKENPLVLTMEGSILNLIYVPTQPIKHNPPLAKKRQGNCIYLPRPSR
jgi:hypothetical protein